MFEHIHSILGFRLSSKISAKMMLGQNDLMIKMAGTEECIDEEGDSEIKKFFEHVIRKTEEILSQSSFSSINCHFSRVLTHVDPWHLTGCGDADPHNSLKSASSA